MSRDTKWFGAESDVWRETRLLESTRRPATMGRFHPSLLLIAPHNFLCRLQNGPFRALLAPLYTMATATFVEGLRSALVEIDGVSLEEDSGVIKVVVH